MLMCPATLSAQVSMRNSRRFAPRVARSGLKTRRALTLVEMLISLVCVIILMLAYTQLFSSVSTRIADARSMIDMTNRMRGVANQLRNDLAGHTCELRPPVDPQAGAGYFEYVEGPLHDKPGENGMPDDISTTESQEDKFLGDTDDVLMFTTRCKNGAFTGKYGGSTVQSQVAEVVWFLRPTLLVDPSGATTTTPANPQTFTLYRRAYLVMPTYQGQPTTITATAATPLLLPNSTFYENNDISVHYDLNSLSFVANTLGDLTKRECRYGHAFISNVTATTGTNGFPHRIVPGYLLPFGGILTSGSYSVDRSNARYGEDVVLTNVVSFDVQAWDPTAPVYSTATVPSVAVSPSDPGFLYPAPNAIQATPVPNSIGAFVDLNWHRDIWPLDSTGFPVASTTAPWNASVTRSPFYMKGNPRSQLVASSPMIGPAIPASFTQNWLFDDGTASGLPNYSLYNYTPATYDTFSTHYEHDGFNELTGGTTNADAAGSGFSAQPETSPPYPAPLRGIKITLRCYEPDSRQMHEISVVESFVPE